MITDYYFFLTQHCPNRCKYCYVDYDAHEDMTIEQIDSYIEQYHPGRIIFFGGEPLLRLDLLEYTVKKYYGKIQFQVVTSTMVNFKEFIEFHKRYPLDEVQLSWDGFTTSRIDINGNSIEDRVYENIMYALSQGMTFDIKSVINNENVDKLLDLHYIFKQLKPYGANGEFVIAHGINYDESFYDSLQKNLIYTFDLDKMYSMHLNKICAYLYDDEYASCDIGKYYTLDSKGILNYCTALAQKNVVLNYEDTQKRCFDKECKHCEYKRICDGGCRYERYQLYGNRWKDFFIYPTCRITKIYFNTISTWLHSLSSQDETKFLSILRKYKEWQYKRFGLE